MLKSVNGSSAQAIKSQESLGKNCSVLNRISEASKSSTLEERVLQKQHDLRRPFSELVSNHRGQVIDQITIDQVFVRGMRKAPTLITNVSSVDPKIGQLIRGNQLKEFINNGTSLGAFWLEMTGQNPELSEVDNLAHEVSQLSEPLDIVKNYINITVDNNPDITPMALLSTSLLQIPENRSFYCRALKEGLNRDDILGAAVLDSKAIYSQMMTISAMIYRKKYTNLSLDLPQYDTKLSWGENYALFLGKEASAGEVFEKMALVHVAQGKGNVSSHTSHLVSTMGADPYKSISACIIALSAPQHAKASVEAMDMIDEIIQIHGKAPSDENIVEYLESRLKSGKKIHGIGQAVMQNLDPRFEVLRGTTKETSKISIVDKIVRLTPEAFLRSGKKLNSANPNVNMILGSCAESVGINEREFLPVIFAVGRVSDPLSQFVENVMLNTTMLRPASLTTTEVQNKLKSYNDPGIIIKNIIKDTRMMSQVEMESLIVNMINNLPQDQVDFYGKAITDKLEISRELGGRNIYRIDIKPTATVATNAVITFSNNKGDIFLALPRKWSIIKGEKTIEDKYKNIGGYMNTLLSRGITRVLRSEAIKIKEHNISNDKKKVTEEFSKKFWEKLKPHDFADYVTDNDLNFCLQREVKEETGITIDTKNIDLISSVSKNRSKGDSTTIINYYLCFLGQLNKKPEMKPNDDVADIDFISAKNIEENNGQFYVLDGDKKIKIDKNNALGYRKAIILSREKDIKEKFGLSKNEIISSFRNKDLEKFRESEGLSPFGEKSHERHIEFVSLASKIFNSSHVQPLKGNL